MQGIDALIHANYKLKTKGLVMVFNPTSETISQALSIPLYYTGLTESASVSEQDGPNYTIALSRLYQISLSIHHKPLGITWFTVSAGI